MRLQYEGYLAAQGALSEVRRSADEDRGGARSGLQQRAGEAEREVVLRERREGLVSAEVADEVLQDVEARAVRDLD